MSEQKAERAKKQGMMLEINFEGAEEVPIAFVNHVFVRHFEDVFLVSFAQSHGPYIVSPTPQQLKQMGKVPARVVARIAIPPTKMKEILDVLNDNYARYLKRKGI